MRDQSKIMSGEKVCISCNKKCTKENFSKRQWRRKDPSCLSCSELTDSTSDDMRPAKIACTQCRKNLDRVNFSKLQLRQTQPLCRFCEEFTKISDDMSRQCHDCKVILPRIQFDIKQWGRGDEALCHCCREELQKKVLDSINDPNTGHKVLSDGTCVCVAHSLECCDICMMDFTLPNQITLKRTALGRDLLTDDETNEIIKHTQKGMRINKKICIMDGQSMCPRSGRKLRCVCDEVTYCSLACQKHHWTIHRMTCKVKAKKDQQKKVSKASAPAARLAHGLTEEQLEYIFVEAFLAENNGGENSIEECAWQVGVHPLLIGGGQIRYTTGNKNEFIKGDVAKIYRERMGVEWDGSPRFGLPAYKQQKMPMDWIAKARQGKSQREKDFVKNFEKDYEEELRRL